ncbi:MAG TPA: hypothetical protein VFU19_13865 [Iamia sp.]|nr:hypothetical protein [Iamia sp.]
MTDVDTILREHADAAAAVEPAADGWAQIVARLGEEPPIVVPLVDRRRAGRPTRRVLLAGAAAVVVVAAAIAAVALVGDDGTTDLTPAESTAPDVTASTVPTTPTTEPPSPPASTEPPPDTTGTPTTTAPPVPAAMPDEVVAIVDTDGDGLGAVVRLGTVEGQPDGTGPDSEVRSVLVEDPPFPDDAPGSATGPVTLDLLPDGSVVYGICCEPAAGAVYVVGPDGGEPRLLGYGEHPAVGPDGTVAVFQLYTGVGTMDVATGRFTPLLVDGEPLMAGPDDWATGLTWSPDGRQLLVDWLLHDMEAGTSERIVELVDLDAGTRQRVALEGAAGGEAHGTFLADGRVAFVTGVPQGYDQEAVGTGIAVFDPARGTAEERFGALRITGLDTTADGGWVLATSEDGAVRAFTGADLRDEGTVARREGLQAAAW